jgi:hypothetical protein
MRDDLAISRPSAPGPVVEPDDFSGVHVCRGSAQHGLSDRNKNGTADHAEHAKGGGALKCYDEAFDLEARHAMNVVDRLGNLQFDEDDAFDA